MLIIGFLGMVPANMFLVNLKDAQHEDGGAEVRTGASDGGRFSDKHLGHIMAIYGN